jgi:hypothetical protein
MHKNARKISIDKRDKSRRIIYVQEGEREISIGKRNKIGIQYRCTTGFVYSLLMFLVPRAKGMALKYWRLPEHPYTRVLRQL